MDSDLIPLTDDELRHELTIALAVCGYRPVYRPWAQMTPMIMDEEHRRLAAALVEQLRLSGRRVFRPPPRQPHSTADRYPPGT